MSLTRSELQRHALELCQAANLNPDDVYRLVLYATPPEDSPHYVGRGMLAYIYKRRKGKKYLKADGEPATTIQEFHYLPELR